MLNNTHFEKIIGGTAKEKERAAKKLEELFTEEDSELQEYELEKSDEHIETIAATVEMVDEIIEGFGADPKPLSLEKIHILRPGSIEEITDGQIKTGAHKPMTSQLLIEDSESSLNLAHILAHELFHVKSYKTAQVHPKEDVTLYRSGLAMVSREEEGDEASRRREYFGVLEEAIVAECNRKFMEKVKDHPLFREEANAINRIKGWVIRWAKEHGKENEYTEIFDRETLFIPNAKTFMHQVESKHEDEDRRAAYAAGIFRSLAHRIKMHERLPERNKMYELLDEIMEKSEGRFESRDEIFKEFAQANFTGNYLKIARIVESALGKGSFRALAEKFSIDPE